MTDKSRITLRFRGRLSDDTFESPPVSFTALVESMNNANVSDEIQGEIEALCPDLQAKVEITFSEGSLLWKGIISVDWQGVLAFAGNLPTKLTDLAHGPLAPFIAGAHIFELGKVIAEIIDHVIVKRLKKVGAPKLNRSVHTVVSPPPALASPVVFVNAGPAIRWWSAVGVSQLLLGSAAVVASSALLIIALSYHTSVVR